MRRSDPLPVPSRRRDRASLEDGGRGCPSERALRGRCRQGVSGNCAPSYPSWWRLLLANGLGGQCYRLTNSDIQSLARKAHEFQQAGGVLLQTASDGKGDHHMSEENKEKVRRVLEEAFGQGKAEIMDEVLHSDFVCWDPNSETGEIRG